MKVILVILSLLIISCKEVVEENIWSDLTPAQQQIMKDLAKDKCIARDQTFFDQVKARIGPSLITSTIANPTIFLTETGANSLFTFQYIEESKGYDADGYTKSEEWRFTFKVTNIDLATNVVTFVLKKEDIDGDKATEFIQFTHDLDIPVFDTYWTGLLTATCTPGTTKTAVTANAGLISYKYETTDNLSGEYDRTVVANRSVYADRPFFFEYFFTSKTVNKLNRKENDTNYNKRTYSKASWTLIDDVTFPESAGVDCKSSTNTVNDDSNFENCFSF